MAKVLITDDDKKHSELLRACRVTYKAGPFSAYIAPYWIITMWMLFAMTPNVSLRWLRGKPRLAALLGFYGSPTSYLAGQTLDGMPGRRRAWIAGGEQ